MKLERRVLGSSLWLAGATVIVQLLNFFFAVYFARSFGAGTLGIYSVSMAAGAIIAVFAGFGAGQFAARSIARDPSVDRQLVGTLLPLQLLLGLLLGLVATAVILWRFPATAEIAVAVVWFHVLVKWNLLLMTRYGGRQQMTAVAAAQVSTRLGIAVLGGLAIYLAADPGLAVIWMPLSAVVVGLIAWRSGSVRYGALDWRMEWAGTRDALRKCAPFFSLLLLSVVYERIGVVLLRAYTSDVEAGLFSAAERLTVPFVSLLIALNGALLPALSRLEKQDPAARSVLAGRFQRIVLAGTLPCVTLLFLYREEIVRRLYGDEFATAGAVLGVICGVIALRAFTSFQSMVLVAADRQGFLNKLKLAVVVLFVALTLVLVPRAGEVGLAWAILLAELALAASIAFESISRSRVPGIVTAFLRPGAACLLVIGMDTFATNLPTTGRLLLTITGLAVALFATGAVRLHDFSFLLRIVRNRG